MIEKQHGQQALMCDSCDDSLGFFERDEFQEMIADAKGQGWKITPDGEGGWSHLCGSCRNVDRVAAARRKFGL